MKEYSVHFSYYSEEYGNFDDKTVKVDAENQFDARRMAWEKLDKNDEIKFMSCVKLCGITWDASKLDMQDYFNSAAADNKYSIQYIENVAKPNAQIEKNDKKYEDCERERYRHFGSLYTISHIAEDLGKSLGMLPPPIFEELHYAREFAYLPDCGFDKASAMLKIIESAENWDSSAAFSIRELFGNGYGMAGGHDLNFSAQFGKDGLYPVHADRTDYSSKYVSRWNNAREYKTLASLPFFGQKDVIPESNSLKYEWQTLVIKKEVLHPDKQIPLNSLWIPTGGGMSDNGGDNPITVENLFTGEVAEWKRSDFIGILKPEKNANIHNETIKAEYHALNEKQDAEKSIPNNGESKKSSILADVREKEKEIAAQKPPDAKKDKQANKDEIS